MNPPGSSPESIEGGPIRRPPASLVVKELVEDRKFSSLTRLVRVIAWVWRAATKWKTKYSATNKAKLKTNLLKEETKSKAKQAVISVGECEDALRDLFLVAQESVSFSDNALSRLAIYKDEKPRLLMDSYWPTRDSLHYGDTQESCGQMLEETVLGLNQPCKTFICLWATWINQSLEIMPLDMEHKRVGRSIQQTLFTGMKLLKQQFSW